MQDPIGSFLRIRELYMSYLDTAFRIGDESVAAERCRLLRSPGSLCTEPLVEPLPRYETHESEFHDFVHPQDAKSDPLHGFYPAERKAFVELVLAGLFPSRPKEPGEVIPTSRRGDYAPYTHQIEMLRRGTRAGSPGIVTSGTGSGKTESFFLPLFAALAKEAKGWSAPREGYLKARWWHDPATGKPYQKYTDIPASRRPTVGSPRRTPFRPHRSGETREAAVRALILYPMNALVEDQLVRLRKALDSREAREVMDEEFKGNRLFFGRYTGKTPVTGHEDHPGFRELLDRDKDDPDLDDSIYFPTHRRADSDGMVSLGDIRESEFERRKRRQKDLFDEMVALERGQQDARHYAAGDEGADLSQGPSAFGEEAPFMFSSVDGGELVSRWDMQATPPDILVTNVSMLGAMLTREVDESIFSTTRAWLEKPDSYFYLILDELHLQRGSAGTEVAYLIRLLLDRLGLTKAEHRHKLRILASSASLPATPEEKAAASAEYLWDMFGRFGLHADISSEEEGREAWAASIVSGKEIPSADARTGPARLHSKPYLDLLDHSRTTAEATANGSLPEAASAVKPAEPEAESLWRAVASDLGIDHRSTSLEDVVRESVRKAASYLVAACWEEEEQHTRATTVRQLAWFLFEDLREFGDPTSLPYDEALQAIRALMFVRGSGDGLRDFLGGRVGDAPSFRVHTFFRSIEGLYAPAWKNAGVEPIEGAPDRQAEVGRLSIERETRREFDIPDVGPRLLRQLELLYCECCGELFFGGMRSGGSGVAGFLTELLPFEPQLDGLPDAAASQRFEELSSEQYAIFWPTDSETAQRGQDSPSNLGAWRPASLEQETGVVRRRDGRSGRGRSSSGLRGHLFDRRPGQDRHGRRRNSAETHVPYACPACGTDYFRRRLGKGRLSPIRNFRAGFAKTTQLLATELFDAQRVANPTEDAKLVSFADSRQDAARAALDIERHHHQDLRRELLVANLHEFAASSQRTPETIEQERDEAYRAAEAALDARDIATAQREMSRAEALEEELREGHEPSIAISSVVEDLGAWDSAERDMEASRLIADMVRRGVHPYDDAGVDRPVGQSDDGRRQKYHWDHLFEIEDDGSVLWSDDPPGSSSRRGSALHGARRNLVYRFYQIMSDVIFSKTYFSLEESGLGYVTVGSGSSSEAGRDPDRVRLLSALLRVIADSYRYRPSPYREEGDPPAPWIDYGDVRVARVKEFAEAVWGTSAESELVRALRELGHAGHPDGIIELSNVRIMLTGEEDPYWRCSNCSRVHLHRGADVCTRCFAPLPDTPQGSVRELQRESFLARRVLRALRHQTSDGSVDTTFRLHCEELTGQTEDPARRQREFRGIFVPRVEEIGEEEENEAAANGSSGNGAAVESSNGGLRIVSKPFEAKDTIDLLAVTTTMEVGIDVGPLQTILQSNMPPQRFNYQQRVGRAGRRGQAFSMALTICRTRSHDIHYFREPRAITGDAPPTPFLTKKMADIAKRFLRKRWLIDAFSRLRIEERAKPLGIYPGDLMSPPDIHGEFMPADIYRHDTVGWPSRLRAALEATRNDARGFLDLLAMDGKLEEVPSANVEELLWELEGRLEPGVAYGLAHSLAELGLLPMFGMPTRVRNLYLDIKKEERRPVASTIDRDLDVAIYEFAPGAKVVKDKHEHLCVGFTPALGLPEHVRRVGDTPAVSFQTEWYGERFRMVQCSTCSAWARLGGEATEELQCGACGAVLSEEDARLCTVPHAFRTDFRPESSKEEILLSSRHRSIQAEGEALNFVSWELDGNTDDGFRPRTRVAFGSQARTYRLNRGPLREDEARGFALSPGSQRVRMYPGHIRLENQAIIDEADLYDFQAEGDGEVVWLAAPKTTDSLYLSPTDIHDGLALYRLPARAEDPVPSEARRWQGVRAAALSATFLVVNRASRELDIDPAELEVLEPRPYGTDLRLPLLQITDQLVNGAGFCRNLSEPERGTPKILRMMHSMISDPEGDPLEYLLREDHCDCEMACYRCLLRYGNQQFHGLLDWRLGLSYLRAMLDPHFSCGLDGDFGYPGLEGWREEATRLAEEMKQRFGGDTATFAGGVVPAFRLDLGGGETSRWALVAHPLWDWDYADELVPGTVLAQAEEEASEDGPVDCWDTFNLSRRPVWVREWIRDSLA